jgi:hypothetical protein
VVIQEIMLTIRQGMEAKMDTIMDVGQEMINSYQKRMEAYQ